MKHLLLFTSLTLTLSLGAASEHTVLRLDCNKIYASNTQKILAQFKPLISSQDLNEYETFMLTNKLHSDLSFKLIPFERAITADIRAQLRTPLTNYTTCLMRVSNVQGNSIQTKSPTRDELSMCDATYAREMQEVLSSLAHKTKPSELLSYKEYMILLKHFEGLAFLSGEFEKKTNNVTTSRLRLPIHEYNTCRDSLVRREVAKQ